MARIEDHRSPAEAQPGDGPGGAVQAQGTEPTVPPNDTGQTDDDTDQPDDGTDQTDDGTDQTDDGIDHDAPGTGIVRDEPPAEPTEPG
jgi:hypothetical protein